jgi:hypothetical protein
VSPSLKTYLRDLLEERRAEKRRREYPGAATLELFRPLQQEGRVLRFSSKPNVTVITEGPLDMMKLRAAQLQLKLPRSQGS